MTTTWNPSDDTGTWTFTSTNHIATHSGGFENAYVRATTGAAHSSGKWYLEYTSVTSNAGADGLKIGFGNTSVSISNALDDANSANIDNSGNIHPLGALSLGAPDGHTLCMAIDLDNKLFWVRFDGGSWHGDSTGLAGDPVAGTHGCAITSALPMTPAFYSQNNFGGPPQHDTATINAGDNAFSFSIPSGFLGWDAPPVTVTKGFGTVIF
jgi:hypothetical protein